MDADTTSTDPLGGVVDGVRDCLDGVASCPVWSLPDAELGPMLAGLVRERARLDALILDLVRQADVNAVHTGTGAASTAAWVRQQTRMSRAEAGGASSPGLDAAHDTPRSAGHGTAPPSPPNARLRNATASVDVDHVMTQGPAPRTLSDEDLSDLLRKQRAGTLATVKRTGHPHLTTMLYSWDADARVVRFSTTADRIKVKQLRRDPHAALHVQGDDMWSFAVAEGEAAVSEITTVPGDAVGRELLGMIPAEARPEDEDAFLRQQVAERRVVIRLKVDRLYGTALDVNG